MIGCKFIYTLQHCRPPCYSSQILGSLSRTSGSCYGDSTIEWRRRYCVNSRGARRMGPGNNPQWRRLCSQQAWRIWRPISAGSRIRSHDTFQYNLFLTIVCRRIIFQDQGYQRGVGKGGGTGFHGSAGGGRGGRGGDEGGGIWEGLRRRIRYRTEPEGIIQNSIDHRDRSQCPFILCYGFGTPPTNIEHGRRSWRPNIYIYIERDRL